MAPSCPRRDHQSTKMSLDRDGRVIGDRRRCRDLRDHRSYMPPAWPVIAEESAAVVVETVQSVRGARGRPVAGENI